MRPQIRSSASADTERGADCTNLKSPYQNSASSPKRKPTVDHLRARPNVGKSAAARNAARPLLAKWLREVKSKIRDGHLIDFDLRLAEELLNYPSANLGYCWPGLERLETKLGRTVRSLYSRLKSLIEVGLLTKARGGRG